MSRCRAFSSQRRARSRIYIGFGLHLREQTGNEVEKEIQEDNGDDEPSRSVFNMFA